MCGVYARSQEERGREVCAPAAVLARLLRLLHRAWQDLLHENATQARAAGRLEDRLPATVILPHTLGRMQPRCQQLLALLEERKPDASGIVAAYDLGFVDDEPAALPALRALAVHVVLDRVLECVLPHVLHATIHSEVFCELYRVAL